jgi:hypothetical protein
VGGTRHTYTLLPDTLPAAQLDVLLGIYRRAIERYEENQEAAEVSGGEDARKEDQNASGSSSIRS